MVNKIKGNYDKNGNYIPSKDACTYCEGTCFHFGKECGACDGTGKKKVQFLLDRVYKAKNDLPLRQSIKDK